MIPSRAVLQVQAGTADYSTNVTAAQEPALAAGSGPGSPAATKGMQQYVVNSLDNLWLYALNTRRPLFSNLQVRQAANYAVDRTALAHNGGGLGPPRQPTDQYLPPGIPGYHNVPVYPLTPDLAKARQLAPGLRATAVLYTCNESTCIQDAQILKNDLAAIGLNVQVHQFPYPVLYDLVSHTGPWDIADIAWQPDYPDPANFLNYLLEGGTVRPPFNNQGYHQRLTQAAEMSGPTRYLTYGELAEDLDRNAAPWITYGHITIHSWSLAWVPRRRSDGVRPRADSADLPVLVSGWILVAAKSPRAERDERGRSSSWRRRHLVVWRTQPPRDWP